MNTTSPPGKGPNQKYMAILVPYDQGSISLGFVFYFSGLAGGMQLTFTYLHFLLFSAPLRDHPLGQQ